MNLEPHLLRRQGPGAWVALCGVVLFALVGIGGPLVGRGVFSAAEGLQYYSPWVDELHPRPTEGISPLGDTWLQYEPSAHEAATRLRQGDLPWTSPYEHGGTMLAAWVGDGLTDLMNLPWLVLPATLAPGYVKLLEIGVAVGFTYLFCRRIGIGRPAAWLGGLAYAASGFQIAWTNWPQSRVGALSPGLLWAVERLVQRRRVGDVALLAALVAWHFGAGFPSVTLMTLTFVGAYALYRLIFTSGRDVRRLAAVAGAGLVAAGLGIGAAAAQLAGLDHVLSASDTSNRAASLGLHSNIRELGTGLIPGGLGLPELGGRPPVSNIVELQTYVGGAVAVMLLGLLVRRRTSTEERGVAGFLAVAAGLSVFLLFRGGPPLELLQRAIPRLQENYFGRWRSVLGLCVAVLAALGADRWGSAETRRSGPQRWRWWLAAVAVVLAAAAFEFRALTPVSDANARSVQRGVIVLLGSLAATVAVLAYLRRRPALTIGLVSPVVALEALMFVLPYWHRSPQERFYPKSALITAAQQHVGTDRVEPIDSAPFGVLSWYRLRTATGYSPASVRWADLLVAVNPQMPRFAWPTQILSVDQALAQPALLDRLGVRDLVVSPRSVPDPLPPGWRVVSSSPGGALIERLTAMPRIRWASTSQVVPPGAQVAVLAAGVDRGEVVLDTPSGDGEGGQGTVSGIDERDSDERTYRVQAGGPGYLVVADAYDSWWAVTVDGRPAPLLHADHALMAVAVAAGEHRIHLSYRVPRTWLALSTGSAALIAALGATDLMISRRSTRTRRFSRRTCRPRSAAAQRSARR